MGQERRMQMDRSTLVTQFHMPAFCSTWAINLSRCVHKSISQWNENILGCGVRDWIFVVKGKQLVWRWRFFIIVLLFLSQPVSHLRYSVSEFETNRTTKCRDVCYISLFRVFKVLKDWPRSRPGSKIDKQMIPLSKKRFVLGLHKC